MNDPEESMKQCSISLGVILIQLPQCYESTENVFSVMDGVDRMLFFIKCCGHILSGDFECHMTECTTAINFHKKAHDTLLHQHLWTLLQTVHGIVRLDMISNHDRGAPQRSITSEISISIIKHVQIIIITIIYIFCVRVATEPILPSPAQKYILADFSCSCSCQFAWDTWITGASN